MTVAATPPYELRSVKLVARGLLGPVRGGETNRKAPSVSVTGALLTGNFFRGQVVPSRHATNQAGRAAGSDYKKKEEIARTCLFGRINIRAYAEVRGTLGRKGARNNTESLYPFFPFLFEKSSLSRRGV